MIDSKINQNKVIIKSFIRFKSKSSSYDGRCMQCTTKNLYTASLSMQHLHLILCSMLLYHPCIISYWQAFSQDCLSGYDSSFVVYSACMYLGWRRLFWCSKLWVHIRYACNRCLFFTLPEVCNLQTPSCFYLPRGLQKKNDWYILFFVLRHQLLDHDLHNFQSTLIYVFVHIYKFWNCYRAI